VFAEARFLAPANTWYYARPSGRVW